MVWILFAYFSDDKYERVFGEFEGIRQKIASFVMDRINDGYSRVLDLLAGHGYLSAELAKLCPSCLIYGTGLKNDVDSFNALKASNQYPPTVWKNIKYTECDVTELPFDDDYFDLVANFLGLEDVMMTRGELGLISSVSEVSRVAKPSGLIEIAIVEYGDTPEERVAEEVWANIGLNAVFLAREFYVRAFAKHELKLLDEMVFKIRKKMTFDQAKDELQFACEQAPPLFKDYGVTAVSFDELMNQFGHRIQKHGMAYYPNIRVLLFSLQK